MSSLALIIGNVGILVFEDSFGKGLVGTRFSTLKSPPEGGGPQLKLVRIGGQQQPNSHQIVAVHWALKDLCAVTLYRHNRALRGMYFSPLAQIGKLELQGARLLVQGHAASPGARI